MPNLARRLRPPRLDSNPRRIPGQSLVEFALVLPVLLLLAATTIDFGRVYLGYVNLQQMARIAGGFAAEHAEALDRVTPDAGVLADYRALAANDAAAINCTLPGPIDPPAFRLGHDLGDPVEVRINCSFHVVTPIISQILGGTIEVSASTIYPVKEGAVAEVPGGGGPIVPAPIADFVGSPTSGFGETAAPGYGGLAVTFTDLSRNGPTSWQWNFGNGTASTKGPHDRQYECDKPAGETCQFSVSLTVGSAGGFDTDSRTDYITITVPPETGPVAEFTATPRTGLNPLNVSFDFVDKLAGTVTYANYEWDFTNDGSYDATGLTVTHNYMSPGEYSVTLRVTELGNPVPNVQTKAAYIVVGRRICTVPDFANTRKNSAQALWATAGFTTNVQFAPGNGNYVIYAQTILGGTADPQPDRCASAITVGP